MFRFPLKAGHLGRRRRGVGASGGFGRSHKPWPRLGAGGRRLVHHGGHDAEVLQAPRAEDARRASESAKAEEKATNQRGSLILGLVLGPKHKTSGKNRGTIIWG